MEIIAEAGTAHGGDLGAARELILAAKEAGADTVKFQAVIADEILHPRCGPVPLHGQNRDLYAEFRRLERPPEFYARLMELAREAGLRFLCSVFGLGTARMMRRLGLQRFKVASPELNHFPLLEELASYGVPLILSSGVSRLSDIESALEIAGRKEVVVLHCVTAYPAPASEYRLHLLGPLSAVFGVPFGVSDHSLDPLIVPLTALTAGAVVLEKHLTLSRQGAGLDDPVALPPREFERMVREIRRIENLSPEDRRTAVEELIGRRAWEEAWGEGPKELAPSERENYSRSNRSVCARFDLAAGSVLTEANTAIVRVEKIHRPGLSPKFYPLVLGKVLQRPVRAGEGIVWEDLLVSGASQEDHPSG